MILPVTPKRINLLNKIDPRTKHGRRVIPDLNCGCGGTLFLNGIISASTILVCEDCLAVYRLHFSRHWRDRTLIEPRLERISPDWTLQENKLISDYNLAWSNADHDGFLANKPVDAIQEDFREKMVDLVRRRRAHAERYGPAYIDNLPIMDRLSAQRHAGNIAVTANPPWEV